MTSKFEGIVKLCVLIPAYNEVARLPPFLAEVRLFLDRCLPNQYEVLVIDDGSDDGTSDYLRGIGNSWSRLRVESHSQNIGKGAAILTGIRASSAETILVADADGAASIANVVAFRKRLAIEGLAAVIGVRAYARRCLIRSLASATFRFLVNTLFDLQLLDAQCGFKLFDGPIIRALSRQSQQTGYLWDIEALLLLRRDSHKWGEHEIAWREVGGSKVSIVRDAVRMLCGLFSLWWKEHLLRQRRICGRCR